MAKGAGMNERPQVRRAPRVRTRVEVQFGNGSHQRLSDFTFNVSSEGIFLATQQLFPVASNVTLEFCLPLTESRIRCEGQVAWVNVAEEEASSYEIPTGMGIKFLNLPDDGIQAIRDFVREGVSPAW